MNTSNKRRRTPMHISAHKDHKSCVEVLIKHGGSVNMQVYIGQSSLVFYHRASSVILMQTLFCDVTIHEHI